MDGRELWRFRIKGNETLIRPPVLHGNLLYLGAGDGNLYVLDLDGSEAWRFKTQGPIYTSVTVENGIAYFGSWDCHIYAVDINTREEVWRFTTSIASPSYLPPAYESFETELSIPKSEETGHEEKKKYGATTFGSQLFGEYKMKSQYKTKSEYKTESEYK
jgi:hypothetical protein